MNFLRIRDFYTEAEEDITLRSDQIISFKTVVSNNITTGYELGVNQSNKMKKGKVTVELYMKTSLNGTILMGTWSKSDTAYKLKRTTPTLKTKATKKMNEIISAI